MSGPRFHVVNGDATLSLLRKTAVPGEFLAWPDMLMEGPLVRGRDGGPAWPSRAALLASRYGIPRTAALARMRRALAEYDVRGIRTTLPFFRWVLEDEDFKAARFDTTFIDRKLADLNGQGFEQPSEEHEILAAIALAVDRYLARTTAVNGVRSAPSRWTGQARAEALS